MRHDFPSPQCTNGSAHHYVEVVRSVFCCVYCLQPLWQPVTIYHATQVADRMKREGRDKVYDEEVRAVSRVHRAVIELQALHDVKGKLSRKAIRDTIDHVRDNYESQDNPTSLRVEFPRHRKRIQDIDEWRS